MNRILQIFRKDVRHLWPQIVIVLAVELALGCLCFWPFAGVASARTLLSSLEALAWWYLIAAVIHEDALRGDRQFWLTRPYSRWDLLAAKAVFIVAFLCLPSFSGQVASLVLRGKPLLAYLPDIVISQVFFLATMVLPAAALASITVNLVEFVWVPLAAMVGLWVLALPIALRFLPRSELDWGGVEWFRTSVVAALALAASAAILLVQYAQRRIWLSRGIMMAGLLAGAFLTWGMPGWHTAFAVQAILGGQQVADPVARVAFEPGRDPSRRPTVTSRWADQKNVYGVSIPVRVSGIPAGMALYSDRAKVTVETASGRRWSSGWDSLNRLFPASDNGNFAVSERSLLPDDGAYWLYVNIDRSVYNGTGRGPTRLHARLALTLLSPERITALTRRGEAQAVANDGFCRVTSRQRLVETDCAWPARTPARVRFRLPSGWDGVSFWGDFAGSYCPYPTSPGLWQWTGQTVRMDPAASVELVTRDAVAHFEREVDVPALEEWPKR